MTNLKSLRIAPEGTQVLNEQQRTRIQIQFLGKGCILGGVIGVIATTGLFFLLKFSGSGFESNLPVVIIFFSIILLMCAYFIIDGIITSHTKLTIDIDNDNNRTVSMMRPVLSQKPITFYSNQKNCIYQTTTRKIKTSNIIFSTLKAMMIKYIHFQKFPISK